MNKTQNVYIIKARKKRRIKKIITFSVLLIIGIIIFITKTDVFKLKNVECTGENLITSNYIIDSMEEYKGQNVIFFNKNKAIKKLKQNPYVKQVEVSRKYPNTLIVNVVESKGLYYVYDGDGFNIISSQVILLEKVSSVEGKNLIEIRGLDITSKAIGDTIDDNTRIKDILEELYNEQEVIKKNNENFSITAVDISDLSQIKVYFGKIEILIGSDQNLRGKMSNAIAVYKTGSVSEYINVSFEGSPDFK